MQKKGRNQRKEKIGMRKVVKVVKVCMREKGKKGAHSINMSVGVQNRAAIWRTIDSGRDTIEEKTSVC